MTIHINNLGAGLLHWVASIKHASPWLSIQPDSGTAGVDSVVVWANSTGLAIGVYLDTVVVSADPGGTGQVSIAFSITPCRSGCFWTTKASMPTPRTGLGVGVVNGVLYAVGGVGDNGYTLGVVEAYDPIANTWMAKASMPTLRDLMAVGVVNGVLYAVGGRDNTGYLGVVEAYDPVANTWTTKASMPTPRAGLGVGVVNGVLYAVGGGNGAGLQTVVEAYDPVANTWTTKASMPTALVPEVGVVNGVLYAMGGDNGAGAAERLVEAYDPVANTWTTNTASMPTAREYFGVGVVNGILYAVGGIQGVHTHPDTALGVVEAYDPAANTWTTKASIPTPRAGLGVGVVNGVLYAVGGLTSSNITGANEAYQP